MSIVTVNKFGNSVGVSDAVQQYVTAAIAEATGPLIENAGPSIPNGIPQYIDTQGKVVKTTPYSLPTTQGNEGEVLQVDASGNIVYGAGGGVNPFNQDLNTFNDVVFNSITTNSVDNVIGPLLIGNNLAPTINIGMRHQQLI